MEWLNRIAFENAGAFWLLLLIPLFVTFYVIRTKEGSPSIILPDLGRNSHALRGRGTWSFHIPFTLQMLGLAFLITALARPTTSSNWKDVNTEGIDIMLAMDVSASMLAKDFRPNRLEASKEVASRFISERPNDRMGLVIYEGESFTQCPLTTDHRVLQNLLNETETGMLKSGTAIGMGLATAVNRLKGSEAKSKVIILLTDGVNNRGTIAPRTAGELAKRKGIRVYTIGVGSQGKARSPVGIYPNGEYKFERVEVEIDEEVLQDVAETTGGAYFRATDGDKLQKIYERIDEMEKSKIKVTEHSEKNEEYHAFLAIAGLLLLLDRVLASSLFRSVP